MNHGETVTFLDEDGMVLGSADKAGIRCRAGEERCLFE